MVYSLQANVHRLNWGSVLQQINHDLLDFSQESSKKKNVPWKDDKVIIRECKAKLREVISAIQVSARKPTATNVVTFTTCIV
jgi:hypothetical protein